MRVPVKQPTDEEIKVPFSMLTIRSKNCRLVIYD